MASGRDSFRRIDCSPHLIIGRRNFSLSLSLSLSLALSFFFQTRRELSRYPRRHFPSNVRSDKRTARSLLRAPVDSLRRDFAIFVVACGRRAVTRGRREDDGPRRGASIKPTDAKRIPPSRAAVPLFPFSARLAARGSCCIYVSIPRVRSGRESASEKGGGRVGGLVDAAAAVAAAASSGYLEFEARGRVRLAPSQTDLPN